MDTNKWEDTVLMSAREEDLYQAICEMDHAISLFASFLTKYSGRCAQTVCIRHPEDSIFLSWEKGAHDFDLFLKVNSKPQTRLLDADPVLRALACHEFPAMRQFVFKLLSEALPAFRASTAKALEASAHERTRN